MRNAGCDVIQHVNIPPLNWIMFLCLGGLTSFLGVQEATSEVMREKINCASHNIQQISAAAAAKTKDIVVLKAHLQQDVDKQEYISMLKA